MHADTPVTLRCSSGRFVKLRGTDTVVHHMKYWPTQVDESLQLWELSTLRLLRYAYIDGNLSEVSAQSLSLSMHLASIAYQVANAYPSNQKPHVHEVLAGFSAFFEGLKFIDAMQKAPGREMLFSAELRSSYYQRAFTLMHKTIEHYDSRVKLGSISFPNTPLDSFEKSLKSGAVSVLDCSKYSGAHLDTVFDLLQTGEHSPSASVLLAFRATRGEAQQVWDVHQNGWMLPSLYPLLQKLSTAGWSLQHQFIKNFDRNYLLPFEGDMGLCVILATQEDFAGVEIEGLERYVGDANEVQERSLSLFDESSLENYDSLFTWSLPEIESQAEPNWKDIGESPSWTPDKVDWGERVVNRAREAAACASILHAGKPVNSVLETFDDLFTCQELSTEGYTCYVAALEASGRDEEATRVVHSSISKPGITCGELMLLRLAYERMGSSIGATAALQKLIAHPQMPLPDLLVLHDKLVEGGSEALALLARNQLMKTAPEDPTVRYLSHIYADSTLSIEDERNELEAILEAASRENRKELMAAVRCDLGIVAARLGDLALVAEMAPHIMSSWPDESLGWTLTGFLHFKQGREDFRDYFVSALDKKHCQYENILLGIVLRGCGWTEVRPAAPFEELVIMLLKLTEKRGDEPM